MSLALWEMPGVGWGLLGEHQWSANHYPKAKLRVLSFFLVNKILLGRSHAHWLLNCLWLPLCSNGTVEDLPEIFRIWPFPGHSLPTPVLHTKQEWGRLGNRQRKQRGLAKARLLSVSSLYSRISCTSKYICCIKMYSIIYELGQNLHLELFIGLQGSHFKFRYHVFSISREFL